MYFLIISILSTALLCTSYRFLNKQVDKFIKPKRRLVRKNPGDYGVKNWQAISFYTEDNLKLEGWLLPSHIQNGTILFIHGMGSNRESLLEQAISLHNLGYTALLFDLRGHGSSDSSVTTLGHHEVKDVYAALAFLKTQTHVNSDRLAVVGHSMGAAIALLASSKLTFEAMILESCYAEVKANLAASIKAFTNLPAVPFVQMMLLLGTLRTKVKLARLRPIEALVGLKNTPVLFIHGQKDKTICSTNSACLFEQKQGLKQLLLIEGVGHRSLPKAFASFEQTLIDFLTSHFPVQTGAPESKIVSNLYLPQICKGEARDNRLNAMS